MNVSIRQWSFLRKLEVLAILISVSGFLGGGKLSAADESGGSVVGRIQLGSRSNENTVVYLKGSINSSFTASDEVILDQKNKTFSPHLLAVRTGQKVVFKNSDAFNHNVHTYEGRRSLFNVIQSIDGKKEWTPERKGVYLVLCDIHSNMSSFIFAFDHPFFATVDATKSEFKIEGIPAGGYTLVAVRDIGGRLVRKEQPIEIRAGEAAEVQIEF